MTLSRWILSAAIVLSAVATAQAQRQRPGQPGQPGGMTGGFGGGGGGLKAMLATNKPLQEELKLSEDQIAKFKEFAEKNGGGMGGGTGAGAGGRGGFGGGATGADDDTRIESLKAQIKVIEDRAALVKATLKEEQAKRLLQLERQQMGLGLYSNTKAVAELKMSDAQKSRVKEINTDLTKAITEAMPRQGGGAGGNFQEIQKKITELRTFASEAVEKELTDDQKKQVKEMLGEKFDMTKLFARPMPNQ